MAGKLVNARQVCSGARLHSLASCCTLASGRTPRLLQRHPSRGQVIREGCVACPANEDVWLEAARLQTPENAKTVLAEAVKKIPQSVKIWLQAASLESNITMRRRVLRRALEVVPNSNPHPHPHPNPHPNSNQVWRSCSRMHGAARPWGGTP